MAATRIQTPGAVMQERGSGGISAGEHLIHDAIIGGGAWAAETAGGTAQTSKFLGLNISLTNTTPTLVWPGGAAGASSGGLIGLANNTGVVVKVEFGLSEAPDAVYAPYGFVMLPPNGAVNVSVPGVRISVARLTALNTPTAANPSVLINHENVAEFV